MKKSILSLSLFLVVAVASANNPDPVSKVVQTSFTKEFPGSEAIYWDKEGDYLKVVFLLGGYRTEAFFESDGHLLGSIRNLFFSLLPLATTKAIDQRFPGADVLETNEITNELGTTYKLTLETKGKRIWVTADGNGNITGTEKVKK